jgi:hypothetical protein
MLVKKCVDFTLIVLDEDTQQQVRSVNGIFVCLVEATEAGKLLNEFTVRSPSTHGLFGKIDLQGCIVRAQCNEPIFWLPLNDFISVFDRPALDYTRGLGYRNCSQLLKDFHAIDFIVRDKSTMVVSTDAIRQILLKIGWMDSIVQITYRRMEFTLLLKALVSTSRNETPPLV